MTEGECGQTASHVLCAYHATTHRHVILDAVASTMVLAHTEGVLVVRLYGLVCDANLLPMTTEAAYPGDDPEPAAVEHA